MVKNGFPMVRNGVVFTFYKLKKKPTCNPTQTKITHDTISYMLAWLINGHIGR